MKLANGNYIRPTARFSWWLRQQRYVSYMMREVSSLFIGLFSLLMVCGLFQLSRGEEAFTSWTDVLWNSMPILSAVMLVFATYHSYTWFKVTPKAMPLKMSGKRILGSIIIGAHLLAWALASAFVWIVFVYGGAA